MSCTGAIQMANTAGVATATNVTLNLGTAQHRQNRCALSGSSTGVILEEPGYYPVFATITFTAPATGNVAVSGQLSGGQLIGVTAAETVNTANTELHTIALTGLAYVPCGAAPATLSLLNTGIAMTPSNVSVTVIKTK